MVRENIPYGRQWVGDDEIEAVVKVLQSDWITQGTMVGNFERALANYCGAKFAVAVSNGTAALHLACKAAGVGVGVAAFTSPITFVASANSALYCGGEVRFADIDPRTYNLAPGELDKALSKCKDLRPGVVIPVHFAGQCCDMESIGAIARSRGMSVIEDACHALGSTWVDSDGNEQKVGNCSHSDMTVFSFHPVKHITTGEGGAILTNDSSLYEKLVDLRSHGITKDEDRLQENHGPWFYEMQALGFNYRITDFQCAMGISQLAKLDAWVERRRWIASEYDKAFMGGEGIIAPYQSPHSHSAYHLYVMQVCGEEDGSRRKRIFEALRANNLGVQVHYIPVHLQPYYRETWGYKTGDFPVAEAYYNQCLSLPIYPKMTDSNVRSVIEICSKVFAEA